MAAVQCNAFFAFSDNILAGMLADSREEIRQEAVEKILQIREEKETFDQDRRVPELNWSSDHFSKMIDWDCHGAILADIKSRAKRIKIETKDSCEVSIFLL